MEPVLPTTWATRTASDKVVDLSKPTPTAGAKGSRADPALSGVAGAKANLSNLQGMKDRIAAFSDAVCAEMLLRGCPAARTHNDSIGATADRKIRLCCAHHKPVKDAKPAAGLKAGTPDHTRAIRGKVTGPLALVASDRAREVRTFLREQGAVAGVDGLQSIAACPKTAEL